MGTGIEPMVAARGSNRAFKPAPCSIFNCHVQVGREQRSRWSSKRLQKRAHASWLVLGFECQHPAAGWRSGSGAYLGHTPVDTACPALIQLAGTAKRQGGGAVGFLQGFAGALFVSTWGGQECGAPLTHAHRLQGAGAAQQAPVQVVHCTDLQTCLRISASK